MGYRVGHYRRFCGTVSVIIVSQRITASLQFVYWSRRRFQLAMNSTSEPSADQSQPGRPSTCLVIGGCGFLGRHLVEKLADLGHRVVVFDLEVTFDDVRVTFHRADLSNVEELMKSMEGVDTVFHLATPNPLLRDRDLFLRVNVDGTKEVIKACQFKEVKNLVLVSSALVVFSGDSIEDGTEDLPYAVQKLSYYIETKAVQEQLVLKADSAQLNTVALRPSGIFGPRDPNMLPNIARSAATAQGRFIIGDGQNFMDFVYVDNVVLGLVQAANALGHDSPLKGKAYNITNDEPMLFWKFIEVVTIGLGHPPPRYHLNERFVYLLAVVGEFLTDVIRPIRNVDPLLTPFKVKTVAANLRFSCARARRDFAYEPKVKLEEGIRKTLESLPAEFYKGGLLEKKY